MRLAANLSWLYRVVPEAERFDAAARDGFAAVEILQPYEQSAPWYAAALRRSGLALVLINTPMTDGAGALGLAAVPGRQADFRHGFGRALAVAELTCCPAIHLMAGRVSSPAPLILNDVMLLNLEYALRVAESAGVVLTLEALNRIDAPGYLYHRPEQALAYVRHFDSPHLRLQFDYYHAAMERLDVVAEVARAAPWIGHAQVAGPDGRHEPDLADHRLREGVERLHGLGYRGWLGCEYQPRASVREGLAWSEPLRRAGLLA